MKDESPPEHRCLDNPRFRLSRYVNLSASKPQYGAELSYNHTMALVILPILAVILLVFIAYWKKPDRFTKKDKDGKTVVDLKKLILWAVVLAAAVALVTFLTIKYVL